MRVFVVRGGVYGPDGPITSYGMTTLTRELNNLSGVQASVHNYSEYSELASEISVNLPVETKFALVGYSGGGWAIGVMSYMIAPRPVELVIALDPSPAAWMRTVPPLGPHVKRGICYYNAGSGGIFSLGFGAGHITGPQVEERTINENHLYVQFDQAIRQQVKKEIELVARSLLL